MRLKACTKCGKFFRATKVEQRICEDCLAAEKSTTIRPRTCRECGTTFDGGPRAWYCPSCRAIRQKEADARRRKNGTIRPLGSIDHCTICGKEYIVNSARQRYCKDCAPEAYRQADREASKKWNKENNYYELRAQKPRRGQKVCVICGNPIPSGTPRVTCSPECDKLRKKYNQDKADIKRGKRKSPTAVERLDKDLPPTSVELTPEVIKELEPDLLDIIKRCPECGKLYVRKGTRSQCCKTCAKPIPAELTPEIITELKPDLLDIIKQCPDCGKLYVRKSSRSQCCKACAYERKKEKARTQNQEYRTKNHDEICEKKRADRAKNPQRYASYAQKYYKTHREAIAKQQAEYREQHKEEITAYRKAYHAEYYRKNKEHIRAQQAEYRCKKKERINVQRQISKEQDALEKSKEENEGGS